MHGIPFLAKYWIDNGDEEKFLNKDLPQWLSKEGSFQANVPLHGALNDVYTNTPEFASLDDWIGRIRKGEKMLFVSQNTLHVALFHKVSLRL